MNNDEKIINMLEKIIGKQEEHSEIRHLANA